MGTSVIQEIQALRRMTVAELRVRWRELYGEESRSRNKEFLYRRLCWKLQEQRFGGLSELAKARIEELTPDGFIRAQVPRGGVPEAIPIQNITSPLPKTIRDRRLPSPGTVITRSWHGRELRLLVLEDGYELDGVRYDSLSEAARAVTGARWNGKLFWGGAQRKRAGKRTKQKEPARPTD